VNPDAASTFSFHQITLPEAERLGHAPDSTSASMRRVGGGIPLARDEAKSLSRLTRLLQSLYPVNTGARRTCLPSREDVHHARAERHAGAARAQENDGFRYRAECKLGGQIYGRLEVGGNWIE
jgi:hypothetical protein